MDRECGQNSADAIIECFLKMTGMSKRKHERKTFRISFCCPFILFERGGGRAFLVRAPSVKRGQAADMFCDKRQAAMHVGNYAGSVRKTIRFPICCLPKRTKYRFCPAGFTERRRIFWEKRSNRDTEWGS